MWSSLLCSVLLLALSPAAAQDIYGCTDPTATNFLVTATFDNGVCKYADDASFYGVAQQPYIEPTEVSSIAGVLDVNITMDSFWYEGPDFQFFTRAYNGALPGPTLRFDSGDTVNVNFNNNLMVPDVPDCCDHNGYRDQNTTNFHTHGLHVSPLAPADNVFTAIEPGESYDYIFEIPYDHHSGTNWYHAHSHGSTNLQVSGGASGVLIVEDRAGEVDDFYLNMPEKVVIIQPLSFNDLVEMEDPEIVLRHPENNMAGLDELILVGGMYQPLIEIDQGTWYRLRVVFAGAVSGVSIDAPAQCSVRLIAKDGVYLYDNTPRVITNMPMAPGNRADIIVKCDGTGQFDFTLEAGDGGGDGPGGMGPRPGKSNKQAATIVFSLDVIASANTETDSPPGVNYVFPGYMTDLLTYTGVTDDRNLRLAGGAGVEGCAINNGGSFDPNVPLYNSEVLQLGSVQKWAMTGVNAHPFHIHVQPFQITSMETESEWHHIGDWHDVLFTEGGAQAIDVMFQLDRFTGDYVLHCHFLDHEDSGCMGYMLVGELADEGTICSFGCEEEPTATPTAEPTATVTAEPTATATAEPTATATAEPTPTEEPEDPCDGPTILAEVLDSVGFSIGYDDICLDDFAK